MSSEGGRGDARPLADVAPQAHNVYVEAESGQITAPFVVKADTAASAGAYVFDDASDAGLQTTGQASYSVDIPASSTYYLWVRMLAPSDSQDSFLLSVNGGAEQSVFGCTSACPSTWGWVEFGAWDIPTQVLTPYQLVLSAGTSQVVFLSRESWSAFDEFLLTDDASFEP